MGKVKPKIALVNDFLFTYGGAERTLADFCVLFPEAPVYTLLAEPDIIAKHFPHTQIITSPLQNSLFRRKPQLLLAQMPRAIESFNLNEYDIVLSASGAFSHGIITGPETVHICYCHTPMRYAWDWHHEYLEEKGMTGTKGLLLKAILSRLRIWDSLSAKRVDHWLCNSGAVAARIQKFYRQESQVIYPPVNTDYFDYNLVTLKPVKPYAITASRLTKNKRVHLMIKACAQSKLPLKIVGGGAEKGALISLAKDMGADVEFLGQLTEEQKREAIANSRCFIFAAEDDFGIAPVEALSLGIPVISFARGGIIEVIKHGFNGLLFQEPTSQSLALQLEYFQTKGLTTTREEIRQSVLHLSRERFLTEIKEYIDHV